MNVVLDSAVNYVNEVNTLLEGENKKNIKTFLSM